MRIGTYDYHVSWERIVSDVFSPPVVWATLAFPIAFRDATSSTQGLSWALTYVGMVCLIPLVFIGIQVKRGAITDLHLEIREQRIAPFVVTMIGCVLAFSVLRLTADTSVMPAFALFSFVQLGVMLGITMMWQISIHAICIAGATITCGILFGWTVGILVAPLILIVGMARIKLHRHTPAQVVAGVLIGASMTILLFQFVL
ncbi:MAG: hypothetical protein SH821_04350 [Phototrophicales bacterium]|nr:hypothetical protein [Phototrophicales bacterium]